MTAKKPLEHERKNCWEVYSSPADRKAMDQLAKRYMDFLSRCKTERKVVAYVRQALEDAGFKDNLTAPACFRVQRGKAVFMARKGKRPLSEGFRLLAAHADAPRIDLKQHPLYEEVGVGLAKTHYYGGIRKHQWLARPLALHGVVVTREGTVIPVEIGEKANDPVFSILDLLPHLAYKQAEKKLSQAFDAEKLNVVLGHAPAKGNKEKENNKVKRKVLEMLNKKFHIEEADLFSAELQVVPAGPARPVGLDSSLIGGYGQDDRACVYACLEAFLAQDKPEHCQVALFFDKEEIGSEGSTSARSLFFEYCMQELMEAWDPGARLSRVMDSGQALSCDVHVALDPEWPDLHEKLNSAWLGCGPSFAKFTGHRGKVGANDAHPEFIAQLRAVLDGAGVPWQMAEMGKVDLGGGGTVAKFLAVYGMDVIDVGPPVLSMHSPFELTSKADIYATVKAFEAFLGS